MRVLNCMQHRIRLESIARLKGKNLKLKRASRKPLISLIVVSMEMLNSVSMILRMEELNFNQP